MAKQNGLREGHELGLQQGLRQAFEAVCRALHIELTDDRKHELAKLDTAGLEAQLRRIQEHGGW